MSERENENQLQPCSVVLRKLSMEEIPYADTDSSSDEDLPYFLDNPDYDLNRYTSKSVKELLSDSINVAETIQHTCKQENSKTRTSFSAQQATNNNEPNMYHDLHQTLEDETSVTESNSIRMYCELPTLIFYNRFDLSPVKCGYDAQSQQLTTFEKLLVSLNPVELENMLSFALSSYPTDHITDCKSFISYLLKMMSVINDKDIVDACKHALQTLLAEHPSVHDVSFSTSELFMLLFNYGVDINKCYLLDVMPELRTELGSKRSTNHYSNVIPVQWSYNLKATLSILLNMMYSCSINHEEIYNILLFLLWISIEEALLNKEIYPVIFKCVDVALENFSEAIWPKTCLRLTDTLLEIENPNWSSKWNSVYFMVSRIPFTSKRGISLRKCISFKALKKLSSDSECNSVLEEAKEFEISSLKLLLEAAISIVLPKLSSYDPFCLFVKFFDICISHVEFKSKVEQDEFCCFLKTCESSIKRKDSPAKSHLLRIFSRLKLGPVVEPENIYIKKECEDNEDFCHIKPEHCFEKSDECSASDVEEMEEEPLLNELCEKKCDIISDSSSLSSEISGNFSINENSETKDANFSDIIIPSSSCISPAVRDLDNMLPLIKDTESSDLSLSIKSVANKDTRKEDAGFENNLILSPAVIHLKNESSFIPDCSSDTSALQAFVAKPAVYQNLKRKDKYSKEKDNVLQLCKEGNSTNSSTFQTFTTNSVFENHEVAHFVQESNVSLGGKSCIDSFYSYITKNSGKRSSKRKTSNAEIRNLSVIKETFLQRSSYESNANNDQENFGDVQSISDDDICITDTANKNILPEKIIPSLKEDKLIDTSIPSPLNSSTEAGKALGKHYVKPKTSSVSTLHPKNAFRTIINVTKPQSFNSRHQSNRNNFNELLHTISDSSSEDDLEVICDTTQVRHSNVPNIPLKNGKDAIRPTVINVPNTTQKSFKRRKFEEECNRKKEVTKKSSIIPQDYANSSKVVNSNHEHQATLSNKANLKIDCETRLNKHLSSSSFVQANSQQKCVGSNIESNDDSDVIVIDNGLDKDSNDCTILFATNDIIIID